MKNLLLFSTLFRLLCGDGLIFIVFVFICSKSTCLSVHPSIILHLSEIVCAGPCGAPFVRETVDVDKQSL